MSQSDADLTEKIAANAVAAVEVLDLKADDVLVVKIGIEDMGDGLPPWIPGPAELEAVAHDVSLTVPEGVRVLVHHMGINFQIVRGLDTTNSVVVQQLPTE